MSRVLVPLAEGFEEIEAVSIIDVLRRAGVEVITAALGNELPVTGSHGISLLADTTLVEAATQSYDLIALPGGLPGAEHLAKSERLLGILSQAVANGTTIAAICAAPMALNAAGLLDGKEVTSYPGVLDGSKANWQEQPVVIDGNIITSMGPATALEFALTLVEKLQDSDARQDLEDRMLITAQH